MIGFPLAAAAVRLGATGGYRGRTGKMVGAGLILQPPSFLERIGFSPWLLVVPAVLLALGLAGTVAAALRSSRQRVSTGTEGMIGERGDVRRRVSPSEPGQVFAHGELWKAFTEAPDSPPLEPGTEVEIVEFRRGGVAVRPVGPGL